MNYTWQDGVLRCDGALIGSIVALEDGRLHRAGRVQPTT